MLDLVAIGAPHARDLFEDFDETGATPPRARRKIRPAEKRLQRWRQPHAHGPAARSSGALDEGHVYAIDVGPLFAIDFDRDEIGVEHRRHAGLLERLVFHDVAPMTRGV